MSNAPRISILIPTYNRDEFVIRAIQSACDGPLDDLEIVVVDNASPPAVYERLASWIQGHAYPVKLFRNEQNLGMTPNWNRCIAHATGEWLGLLCSDDYYEPGAVAHLRELVTDAPHPCLVIADPALNLPVRDFPAGPDTVKGLRLPMASGNFWHRDISATLGGFDEQIKYSPDAEYWYRIAASFPVRKIRTPLSVYVNHEQNYMYATWAQPDFLRQIERITRTVARYRGAPNDSRATDALVRQGLQETVLTILQCCCRDRQRKHLFRRYLREAWRCASQPRDLALVALCVWRYISDKR